MKKYQVQEWQKDYTTITTNVGQLWSKNGIMLGVRPQAVLQDIVKKEKGFVISSQAVGLFDKE